MEALQQGGGTFIKVDTFSSGVYTVDWSMGCGGVPRGRVIEVFGGESSGKTTLTLKMIASCQNTIFPMVDINGKVTEEPGVAVFVDAEHALDPQWATANGVDMSKLLLSQPDNGEQAIAIVETMAMAGAPLIIVDSVAALIPKKELEGEIEDSHIGAQARLMSKALRKLTSVCAKSKSTIVFINQLREKIGITMGSPETTPGGRALKFYASIRIDMRSSSLLKENEEAIGRKARAKIIKNKVAPPWKTAEFEIWFGNENQKPFPMIGADGRCSLLKAAQLAKVIRTSGSWYYHGDDSLGNGFNATIEALTDEKLFKTIKDEVMKAIQPKNAVEAKDITEPDIDDDVPEDE